jgi:signal transduction histidine kinase
VEEFVSGVLLACLVLGPVFALLARWSVRKSSPDDGRAADIDAELSRLTGELAHEIKNPLSTIKVNLKLTKEALEEVEASDLRGAPTDRRQSQLASAARKIAVVQKETDRLEQILDGFLRYVRRPDLQLVTVDLNELVGDMIDFYSPQAQSHCLTMRQSLATKPLVGRVDPTALKQVLLNLFINAQQAQPSGGELMIRTTRRGGRAFIQVSDTGEGIPPERLGDIFRPYHSSRAGGSGLGLATAKKIIEAHQGTIAVHSEPGKGTSFTIEIPLVDADHEQKAVAG